MGANWATRRLSRDSKDFLGLITELSDPGPFQVVVDRSSQWESLL